MKWQHLPGWRYLPDLFPPVELPPPLFWKVGADPVVLGVAAGLSMAWFGHASAGIQKFRPGRGQRGPLRRTFLSSYPFVSPACSTSFARVAVLKNSINASWSALMSIPMLLDFRSNSPRRPPGRGVAGRGPARRHRRSRCPSIPDTADPRSILHSDQDPAILDLQKRLVPGRGNRMDRPDPEGLLECFPRVMIRIVDYFTDGKRCEEWCQEGNKYNQFRKAMEIGKVPIPPLKERGQRQGENSTRCRSRCFYYRNLAEGARRGSPKKR